MHTQRARGAEKRTERRLSNGPLRAQSKALPSILRRQGRRYMPGICLYPAKRAGFPANQGGTATVRFVLDSIFRYCQGLFLYHGKSETGGTKNGLSFVR